jgi:hypothetical protein
MVVLRGQPEAWNPQGVAREGKQLALNRWVSIPSATLLHYVKPRPTGLDSEQAALPAG